MKRTFNNRLSSVLASPLLASLLATQCFAADHFIGINFVGVAVNSGPTYLAPTDSAGVVPQVGWNNLAAYSVSKGILSDEAGKLTGVHVSYLTGEMYSSGTFNAGAGFTSGNDMLLNGYLNSLDPTNSPTGTNSITFTNLSPSETYTIIAYTVRDVAGAQAAYWVNEDFANAFVLLSEDETYWQFDPTFRQGTNTVRPATEFANYVRWDGVSPRPNGTITVNVRSEFDVPPPAENYRGPINGIQLISTNSWPTNSDTPQIVLQPRNVKVSLGESGTFRVTTDGPWAFQWFSNNVAIPGATSNIFTTVPISSILETTNNYRVNISNGPFTTNSVNVNLVLVPALPPGGIFYDGFDYPAGELGNWGSWNESNPSAVLSGPGVALVSSNGLTYTDQNGLRLAVTGGSLVPPREGCWCSPAYLPIKAFDTNQGGADTVIFMSFLYDFRNRAGGSGGIGFSGFNLVDGTALDWGNERFWVGTRGTVMGYDSGLPNGPNSDVPTATNGFIVVRLTQDASTTTADMYYNPPLDALPDTPTYSAVQFNNIEFNGVGVNAGDWNKADVNAPGPFIDEFRFGTTYGSVAPIAPVPGPTLTIQLVGSSVQISWPAEASGYILQQRDNVTSGQWVPAPAGNPVTIPASQQARFYRLIK
jgi:hypothetical protein